MDETLVVVPLDTEIGQEFENLEKFEEYFKKCCEDNKVQYFKKDSKTIDSARKKKIYRYLNPQLRFYYVQWNCIHGGRSFKGRGKGLRKAKTLRKEILCPAHVKLNISDSDDTFKVSSANLNHNHIVSEKLYKQLPHNRRLPDDIKKDVKNLLRMKANKHILRIRNWKLNLLIEKLCQKK